MRFGVIGAGVIGRLRAQSIQAHPGATLVGVADPLPDCARAACSGEAVAVTDAAALLDRRDVDAVVVATPLPLHEEQVLAAIGAGKHVLCEKPLGNTVAGSRRMVEEARAAGVVLATGFNHRYFPAIKFLKQAIDDGRIGTLDHLRIVGAHDGLANFRAEWQYRAPDSGGGAMMDVGIHMTDLARYILGDISEVYGVMSETVWRIPGSEDNAIAIFKSPAGVPVTYQATWTEWRGYHFHVDAYGDRGMVRGSYAPMFNMLISQDKPGGSRKTTRRFYPEIMIREKLKSWTSTALLSFEDELGEFLRMVDGEPSTNADGFAGFRAVEIADAVRRSTLSGQPVRLTEW